MGFGCISCLGGENTPEKQEKVKVLEMKVDAAYAELGKVITEKEATPEAIQTATKAVREANDALDAVKDSGGSWWDIGKGALGGVFGRTILHAARMAIVAYFPGTIGTAVAGILGMSLGGSGAARKLVILVKC